MNLEAVLAQLQGVKRNGTGWQAHCPAHEDKDPSLSVCERNGNILLKCFAGCSFEAVCGALEIEPRQLFSDNGAARRIVAEYGYQDESGNLLFQVVRSDPKSFRQRQPDGKGGWIWNCKSVQRILYRLPEVLAAKSVLVCEGEKDCETARALGIVATCNAGGAGKWRDEYSEPLRGKQITVIADADEPGRKHAQQVAASLFGKAESVNVLEFAQAKDLSEWTATGGTRDALLELIRNAPMGVSQFCVLSGGCFRRTVDGPCCWSVPAATRRAVTSTVGNGTVFRDGRTESGVSTGDAVRVLDCATLPRAAICARGLSFGDVNTSGSHDSGRGKFPKARHIKRQKRASVNCHRTGNGEILKAAMDRAPESHG
jgi:5S rRNA maturation endonuclease (ribonuclease M5)